MSISVLQSQIADGVWSVVLGEQSARPDVSCTYLGQIVQGLDVSQTDDGHWVANCPIPSAALSDGVHSLCLHSQDGLEPICDVTLVFGNALANDIRAEVNLLRDEVDLLKRALRRFASNS